MTRDERRKLMPICTSFIDDIRECFGELKYIRAEENGLVVIWRGNQDSKNARRLAETAQGSIAGPEMSRASRNTSGRV